MKFIINTAETFRGNILNTMTVDGYADYTDGQTFEEYNAKHGGTLKVISEDEFHIMLEAFNKEAFDDVPWSTITKDRYWDLLECLPPCKWHDITEGINSFFISEALTGVHHRFCIKDTRNKEEKYYSAIRNRFISDEKLLNDFLTNRQD